MMNMVALLLFLVFIPISAATAGDAPYKPAASVGDAPYKPAEHTLLMCGSILYGASENETDASLPRWIGDTHTYLSMEMNVTGLSDLAYPSPNPIPNRPPYYSARIIHDRFSYLFPVSSGRKILRLHFFTCTCTNHLEPSATIYDATTALFGVTVNNHFTLLDNFSPNAAAKSGWPIQVPPEMHHVKEFIINTQGFEFMEVTFIPSPGSFAFINGIEILSLPENLYMGIHVPTDNRRKLVFVNHPNQQFIIDENTTAFETMNRLTMGGKTIGDLDDTGIFREWVKDTNFMVSLGRGDPISNDSISLTYPPDFPAYTAPAILYKTARAMGDQMVGIDEKLAWNFRVDTGYNYLLRLHFCEFREGQGLFKVYIFRIDAGTIDVENLAGGTGIPLFRDYVVWIGGPAGGARFKYELNLAIGLVNSSGDAFVNGVEVFKLSTPDGYLAGVNPPALNPIL